MIDLEKKAEEYCLNKVTSEEVFYHAKLSDKIRQAYIDGYKQGQKDCVENNFDEELSSKAVEIANEYDNFKKENEELKKDKEYLDKVNNEQTEVILKLNEQIEKMKDKVTDIFEDMEADMCGTENEVLFDYLKRFLKKYEVIV